MFDLDMLKKMAETLYLEEMARQLDVKAGTLRYHLKKNNIPLINGRSNLDDKLKTQILKLVDQGMYGTQIAKHLNISQQNVRYFLSTNNINVSNGIKAPRVSEDKNNLIRKLAAEGFNKTQIGKKLGVSREYIVKYCQTNMITLTKGTFRKYTKDDAAKKLNPKMKLTGNESKGFYEVQCKVHPEVIRNRPVFDLDQGCPQCITHCNSKAQTEIKEWVESLGLTVVENFKIDRKHIDIYIPSLNLGIEYNGLYWHSEEYKKSTYHKDKLTLANENGIRLITIFEDEWENRQDQVKSFLMSILSKSEHTLQARKLVIKEIDHKTAANFYDMYHIQGKPRSKLISFGLMNNDELIGLTSGSQHHRNNKEFVLSRLVFKTGYRINGGASRLISALKDWAKINGYSKIISWSDNRWSEGNVYSQTGFILDEELDPDYSYVRNGIRSSKQSKQKKNLIKEGAVGNTEYEMALYLGYSRIYDCGKKRWVFYF